MSSLMRQVSWLWIAVIGASGILSSGNAADVKCTITYVSATAIYIGAGRAQGVETGTRADVLRDGKLLAILEVQFVADNSASCRLLESEGTIRVGDEVSLRVPEATPVSESPESRPSPEGRMPTEVASPTERSRAVNRVSGHIGIGSLWQQNRDDPRFNVAEPSLALRLRVENLLASQHTLSIRLRGRQSLREHEFTDTGSRRWTGRIYEVSLVYDNPQSAYHYAFGRVLNRRLRGVGYFDGALFDYRTSPRFTMGVFGGTEPDPRTTEVRTRETKLGFFGAFETGQSNTQRLQTTLALAGRYIDGQISREFLYEQMDYSRNSRLWLLQSAELNILRGWQNDMSGSRLELANLLLSARWKPRHDVVANVSYDNRTTYRTWETRATPDSLFDDSRRNGLRGGIDFQPTRHLLIGAGAGLRTGGSQVVDTKTTSLSLSFRNLFWRSLTIGANLRTFSNAYTRGAQPSLTISHHITPRLYVSAQVGRSSYDYRANDESISSDWLRLQSEVYLSSRIYASAYAESYSGDESSLYRLSVESGIRF